MIERLRMLSPPLKYLVYAAGVLMLLFVAIGVGALAAVVVDRQFGITETGIVNSGSSQSSSSDASNMGTTDTDEGMESTIVIEDTEAGKSGDSENSNKAAFVHKATAKNSRGDYTYISESRTNGNANAIVLASPTQVKKNTEFDSYQHHIGVWYESRKQKWAIFNEDLAPVPEGSTFNVVVPQASASFVHRAKTGNISGASTYLDSQLTNGNPDAVLSVTQNWNPGGGQGVYNDHSIGTVYEARREKWAIYNKDGAPMPEGAAFNITVSPSAHENLR